MPNDHSLVFGEFLLRRFEATLELPIDVMGVWWRWRIGKDLESAQLWKNTEPSLRSASATPCHSSPSFPTSELKSKRFFGIDDRWHPAVRFLDHIEDGNQMTSVVKNCKAGPVHRPQPNWPHQRKNC